MAVNERSTGGLLHFQFWARNSSGYMSGDQTSPADDTTTHALLQDTAVATDLSIRELVSGAIRSADSVRGYMFFGETGIDPFTITNESNDPDNMTLAHGTAVDTTSNTEVELYTYYSNAGEAIDIGMAITQQAQERDGSKGYETVVIPHARAMVRKVYTGYQGVDTYVWRVAPQRTTVDLFGEAFADYNLSVLKGEMDHYVMKTDKPIAFTTYVGDGTATTFTTKYKPTSSVVTDGATPNWFARNGTHEALASVAPSTGLATMSAAGSASDFNILQYETDLIEV